MARELSPEQRREFEEFLSQDDAGNPSIAPSMREHVEAAVEIDQLAASFGEGWRTGRSRCISAARLASAPDLNPGARIPECREPPLAIVERGLERMRTA